MYSTNLQVIAFYTQLWTLINPIYRLNLKQLHILFLLTTSNTFFLYIINRIWNLTDLLILSVSMLNENWDGVYFTMESYTTKSEKKKKNLMVLNKQGCMKISRCKLTIIYGTFHVRECIRNELQNLGWSSVNHY